MTLTEYFDRPEKWARRFRDGDGICFLHALNKIYGSDSYYPICEAVIEHLGLETRYQIVNWNDSKERTFEEIQRAAAIADEAAKRLGLKQI